MNSAHGPVAVGTVPSRSSGCWLSPAPRLMAIIALLPGTYLAVSGLVRLT